MIARCGAAKDNMLLTMVAQMLRMLMRRWWMRNISKTKRTSAKMSETRATKLR